MNPTAKKNNEKLLAVIAAVTVFGALIFSVMISPKLKERKQCLEKILQLNLKLAKMRSDLLIKDHIDKVYLQVEPLLGEGGTDQQKISLFTRELNELYAKLNVKINSVKILPIINETFYKRLLIRVEMSGHVKSILNFVFSVEAGSVPMKIEELDFKSQDIADSVRTSFLISKVVSEKE